MKLSGPAPTIGLVLLIVVILVVGYFYARHATGADVVDQIHADMKKVPAGKSPVTPDFIEQMRQRKASGGTTPVPSRP